MHLEWGDVEVDNYIDASIMKIYYSKCISWVKGLTYFWVEQGASYILLMLEDSVIQLLVVQHS